MGALIIRIGFLGPIILMVIIRNPQNSIGNYLGTFITHQPAMEGSDQGCISVSDIRPSRNTD